jgi:hypothetical protein
MATKHSSFTLQQARATAAIAGIQKYYSTTATLLMAGVSYTPTQLINLLQAYVSAITALQALHAQLHDAAVGAEAQKKQVHSILLVLQAFVTNQFGSSSSKLADFGFSPRKVGVESAATRAASAAKGKATRAAKKAALEAAKSPATPAPATSTTTTKS